MERSGKHHKDDIPQNRKRRFAKARAARRRRRRNRRILIACLAVAAVLIIAVAGFVIAGRNRAKREAEEAARARTADVTEAAFSNAAPGDPGVNLQPVSSGETTDSASVSGTGTDAATQEGTDTGADLTSDTQQTHVEGIGAFSLYRFDEAAGQRVKTERYETAWTRGEDIISLEAFATDEAQFALSAGGGGAWYDAWRAYWYAESGAENCRIGYRVSFRLQSGEEINATLLKPGAELFYREYLENYLYDDAANAYAGWYSHLEPGQETDETLLTSIKFTPGERVDEIDGTITVTAFVYDSADRFDADGTYTGDVAFTTVIARLTP